jgi:hypothetical protein
VKAFVRDVLLHVGAEVADEGPALTATLPEEGLGAELAAKLGRRELVLVFEAEHAGQGELVAPGSHLLRAVEEWLTPRGRRTYLVQPAEERLTLKGLREAGYRASRGRKLSLEAKQAAAGHDLIVVYRLRYRSRQRVDELEAVKVALRPGALPRATLLPQGASTLPEGSEAWELKPRKRPPTERLEAALQAADAVVAERAREVGLERREAARRSFGKDVKRLHAYYSGRIAELERKRATDLTPIRIAELEEEQALRLQEIAHATEVSVEIEPLQVLAVEVPLQLAQLTVKAAERRPAAALPIQLDRASGALAGPGCQSCQEPLADPEGDGLGLDGCGAGHLVHHTCVGRCDHCAATICGACESAPCEVCALLLCPSCGATCPGCARAVCPSHEARCGVCGDAGCAACREACAACATQVCARDRVEAEEGFLCTRCAVTCPGCREATASGSLSRCDTCGRRFCPACLPADAEACTLCSG